MKEGEGGQASALVAMLFEALPVGVLAEDSSRNIFAVNDRFVEMFAFPESPEVLIGRDCVELVQQASSSFVNASGFVAHTNELVETPLYRWPARPPHPTPVSFRASILVRYQ